MNAADLASAVTATTTTTTSAAARLAAAELAAPRFRGRLALVREATVEAQYLSSMAGIARRLSRPEALEALEAAANPATRRIAVFAAGGLQAGAAGHAVARAILRAVRDAELAARAEACLLPHQARASEQRARRAEVRAARTAARAAGKDTLAEKAAGEVLARYIERRTRRALERACFRETRHGAEQHVAVVADGAEGASSATSSVRPQDVGLPNAYARVAYWVSCSRHEIRASLATARLADRAERGVLYLRADLRVVQGRGTALELERLIAGRGGALRWVRA